LAGGGAGVRDVTGGAVNGALAAGTGAEISTGWLCAGAGTVLAAARG
jgi:hypothetical protein